MFVVQLFIRELVKELGPMLDEDLFHRSAQLWPARATLVVIDDGLRVRR